MKLIKYLGNFVFIFSIVVSCSNLIVFLAKEKHLTIVEPAILLTISIAFIFVLTLFFTVKTQLLTKLLSQYLKFIFPLLLIGFLYVIFYLLGFGNQISDTLQYIYIIPFNIICSIIIFSYLIYFMVEKQVVTAVFELIALLIITSVFIDVFYPATFSEFPTRAAGLPENPNATSYRLVTSLGLLLFSDISQSKKYFYLILSSIAVFATFSRSGILLLVIVLVFFLLKNIRYFKKEYIPKIALGALVLILFYQIMTSVINLPSLIDLFSTQLNSERFSMITSTDSFVDMHDPRVETAKMYLNKVADKPIWGYGPLATTAYPVGPHNMFLLLWFESGIIGLSLYIIFIINIFLSARKFQAIPLMILGVCVLADSIFSHRILNEYYLNLVAPLIFYYVVRKDAVEDIQMVHNKTAKSKLNDIFESVPPILSRAEKNQ